MVLAIPQFHHSFFLIWDFILFLVLLRLFLNKLTGFFKVSRNPIPWLVSILVETETGQSTGRKWVGSVLTSSLTFNFTQVKVKSRYASQSELYIFTVYKIILTQKRHREVSITIVMNWMFKPAVFNNQHLNSNREDFFAFLIISI